MSDKNYSQRNADVMLWGKGQIAPLKAEIKALQIKNHSGQMNRFLRDKYFRWNGRINGIGFNMPQHAVFVHKGVGRGYPIDAVGGRALGLTNSKKRQALEARGYNQRAIGRFLKPGNPLRVKPRKPKPWFNPVIDRAIPNLANTVARHNADIAARNIYIL